MKTIFELCLPRIADALHVEERFVGLRLRLVQRPEGRPVGWLVDGPVHDDGHPHVGVRLQTEGDDGHADEEHRHHGHHLKEDTFYLMIGQLM
ncbi:hypothetical protein CDAR_375151 [Caerostris darwini]|uniref:Uncharacterized protein n=1 Tax=Caerostris darwini TaxID=1538125 RepID=A0AAV4RLG6_9ARAC|nr:hypothetical protein CDAR_375151 [Caerostris darwini]